MVWLWGSLAQSSLKLPPGLRREVEPEPWRLEPASEPPTAQLGSASERELVVALGLEPRWALVMAAEAALPLLGLG